jgi:hypothetical protein
VFPVINNINDYDIMETLFKIQAPKVAATNEANSKYIALVEKIDASENKATGYDGTVASMLWTAFAKMSKTRNTWRRSTFKALLIHLYNQGGYAVLKSPVYVDVLVNVSAFGLKMQRPIEEWVRPSFIPDEQLEDLIDHCFAIYPTPTFLITAFYEGPLNRMLWFIRLGTGAAPKTLPGFPEHFTAKMVYLFLQTPKGFTIEQALVRAEALGYGASTLIADQLAWSKLADVTSSSVFWSSVIQFFAKAESLDMNQLRRILEFLEATFQANASFSLKGRTMLTLERDTTAWQEQMQRYRDTYNQAEWPAIGIPLLYWETSVNNRVVTYKTVELLTADALYQEGIDMRHCVAEYVDECLDGDAGIFSLRKYDGTSFKKMATIAIDPDNHCITEAQGNCNASLTKEAIRALEVWEEQGAITMNGFELDEAPHVPDEYHHAVVEERAIRNKEAFELPKILFWILWSLFILFRNCSDM